MEAHKRAFSVEVDNFFFWENVELWNMYDTVATTAVDVWKIFSTHRICVIFDVKADWMEYGVD